jgi:hypothetical protein
MKLLSLVFSALFAVAAPALAQQGQAVDLAGSRVLLIKPKAPQGSLILMPGGAGAIGVTPDGRLTRSRGNSLVRTWEGFLKRNYALLIVDADTDLRAAVDYMAAVKRPVIVAGTSRGTLRAAEGIARGARPDRLVLTSGFLSGESGSIRQNVMSILGSPDRLPPTLVVHHRQDGCRFTLPAGVDPFLRWAGGRARVTWIDGGVTEGDPCEAFGHHGFNGVESRMISAVTSFR